MITKTAIITGGSSGLGFAFAEILAKDGYHLGLVARDQSRLNQAQEKLKKISEYNVDVFSADVSKEADMQLLGNIVKEKYRKIDFLIVNAGTVQVKTLLKYENFTELRQNIDIDLWGAILTVRCLLPYLSENGKILFISSAFALMGAAGYTTYCAAKAGVLNFAEALRRELLATKQQVYVACPADIDTPQYREEIASLSEQMKNCSSHRQPCTAESAAKKILVKCHGDGFLIIINKNIKRFMNLSRFLPRRWRDAKLDRLFSLS